MGDEKIARCLKLQCVNNSPLPLVTSIIKGTSSLNLLLTVSFWMDGQETNPFNTFKTMPSIKTSSFACARIPPRRREPCRSICGKRIASLSWFVQRARLDRCSMAYHASVSSWKGCEDATRFQLKAIRVQTFSHQRYIVMQSKPSIRSTHRRSGVNSMLLVQVTSRVFQ